MSETVILAVTGMKCGGCETNVTGKLNALAGVVSAKAEFKEQRVTVEFNPEQTTVDAITQVIMDAGFVVN